MTAMKKAALVSSARTNLLAYQKGKEAACSFKSKQDRWHYTMKLSEVGNPSLLFCSGTEQLLHPVEEEVYASLCYTSTLEGVLLLD